MSPIQSILVHIDAGPHCGPRLRLARALAGRVGAGVTALYSVTPAFAEVPMDMAAAATAGAADMLLAIDEARLATARKTVAAACAEPGVQVEWQQAATGAVTERAFVEQALYADLLVLGQHDPDHGDDGVLSDFAQSIVIASGKPAIVVPYIGARASEFETAFVAWKETPEAARAVSAALPIIRLASQVHVAIDAEMQQSHRTWLQHFLERHGVQAKYHHLTADAAEAGDVMLSMAAELSADLMVMGCYGHSRARELVLGGASRTVMRSMTLPVLMSH